MGGVRKYKEDYIPVSGKPNRSQKSSAKEAILKLLALKKHTETDIAEHFGLPGQLVNELIKDMEKTGRVSREKGTSYIILNNDVFWY
ncbi:helix-turn-helix domain-containing protein [Desulfoscipio geothermicus]|uniref:Sugar-specific transcriptional regulator TrmB n=1 Tax=Desulfoscipio geothermicus DSM 3669 TaxID=1121426 RepID=A0A1I6D9F7_9FIRM|nr:helix-turn-helix domain-containing protein [Desulfoscipio geothermicus]SFR02105.1 Sugar-specific transcriptional regulator TrmB [Desulfoscipio geothermicus DSM 3669]